MKSDLKFSVSDSNSPCRNVRMRCPIDCSRTRQDLTDMSIIRASADQFVERFGDDAINQAILRADELLHAKNFQACVRWQLIGKEIESQIKSSVN